MLRLVIAVGAVLFVAAAPASAQTSCYRGNQNMNSRNPGDQFVQSMMIVSRNRSCRAFQTGQTTTTGVETPPSHGRIEITDGSWTYTPERNYRGPDSATVLYNVRGRVVRNVVTIDVR